MILTLFENTKTYLLLFNTEFKDHIECCLEKIFRIFRFRYFSDDAIPAHYTSLQHLLPSNTQEPCMSTTKANLTPHPHLLYEWDAFELHQSVFSCAPELPDLQIRSSSISCRTPAFQIMHTEQPFSCYCICPKDCPSAYIASTNERIASEQPL